MKSLNINYFHSYKEFYNNGDIHVKDGYIQFNDDELIFHGIKFYVERNDIDIWTCKDEFELILIMNAYKLPLIQTDSYPCKIEFIEHYYSNTQCKFTYRFI